jgi:RNA polymerase sigma-70 factor, ECF subfamily
MSTNAQVFAEHRGHLFGIAYRMLGSKADAEDVLQDAWLRWHEQDVNTLRSTEAWLTTMVTRLSIDRLRSVRTQRALYFGPWLPEPLADAELVTPESHAEFASDLSVAFLAMLERLGPEERAAFVLHDVFECDYDDIAETLGKTQAACRQLVHRARERVATERRRFRVDDQTRMRMLKRFIAAANRGDYEALKNLFAEDAIMTSDGGGKAVAVLRPLHGAARIARLWYAIARRHRLGERRIVRINNEVGIANFVLGRLHSVSTIDTDGERIYAYYSIANPDKLGAFRSSVTTAAAGASGV